MAIIAIYTTVSSMMRQEDCITKHTATNNHYWLIIFCFLVSVIWAIQPVIKSYPMVNILPLREYNKTAVFVVDALQPHASLTSADTDYRNRLEDALHHYRAQGATIVHVFSKAEQDHKTYVGPDILRETGMHPLLDILSHEEIVYKNGPTFSGASGANNYANDFAETDRLPRFDTMVVVGRLTCATLLDLTRTNPKSTIIAYMGLTQSPSHPFRNLPPCTERPAWLPEGKWKPINWGTALAGEDITAQNLEGSGVQLLPLSTLNLPSRPTGLDALAQRLAASFSR